jgi:hypothetical protein
VRRVAADKVRIAMTALLALAGAWGSWTLYPEFPLWFVLSAGVSALVVGNDSIQAVRKLARARRERHDRSE